MLGPLGGFVTILGFLLPFNANRSLFTMMDGTTLPFLPQLLLLSVVAAIILYGLNFSFIPNFISMLLFVLLCFLYYALFCTFSLTDLIRSMQIGVYVLPIGSFIMTLHPFFLPDTK